MKTKYFKNVETWKNKIYVFPNGQEPGFSLIDNHNSTFRRGDMDWKLSDMSDNWIKQITRKEAESIYSRRKALHLELAKFKPVHVSDILIEKYQSEYFRVRGARATAIKVENGYQVTNHYGDISELTEDDLISIIKFLKREPSSKA